MSVVIETTLGDITVDLYLYERPRACLNFLKLCKMKYYNFNLFHTISRGFIAQTGDPTGSRTGGETVFGILEGSSKRYFEGENEPRIKHTKPGLISFVGDSDKMIGSQFFLTLGEDITYLDEKHCVFGEVVEGFDILEVINEVICDTDDRPYQDVRITHTVVLDDPYPDPSGLMVPSRSPSPNAERLQGGRIAPDEDIDETVGKSSKEVAEMQAEREAKARATILEMVGDIPDAEIAPPENVLFVCKLNPTTNDDDLEIIFSRFGKIKSCEVIRDRKSGDSLQYAFIEFEERKSCEEAYFKMDNVLIDDRRIHVDFSQSVSKVRWLGKGRITYFDNKGSKNDLGKGIYKNGEVRENTTIGSTKHATRQGKRDRPIENDPEQRSNTPPKRRGENTLSMSRKRERSRERRSRSPKKSLQNINSDRIAHMSKSPRRKFSDKTHNSPEQSSYTKTRTHSGSPENQQRRRQCRSRSADEHSSKSSKRSYSPTKYRDKKQTVSVGAGRSRSPISKTVRDSKHKNSKSPTRSSNKKGRELREGRSNDDSRRTRDDSKRSRGRNLSNLPLERRNRSRTPDGSVSSKKFKKSKARKYSDNSDTDEKKQRKRVKKDKQKQESKSKKRKVYNSDSSLSSDSESEEILDKKSKHKKKRKRKISHSTDTSGHNSDSGHSSSTNSSSSDSSSKNRHKRKKAVSKKRKKRK